jgi:saccharopine dehydrogenase (NAD+, L-lysine-forming)
MKYAVVGAGNVGQSLMFDVWQDEPDAEFIAIDPAAATLKQLEAKAAGRKLDCLNLDAADVGAVAKAIKGAAVVANCSDGARCVEIMRAAIQAGVDYVDVHGTLLVEERFALSDEAARAGVTALIGMGCSPGITNMLGAYGARRAKGRVSVDVEYVTHRPLNPSGGLLETALRQFRDPVRAPVYEDGKIVGRKPFEGALRTTMPGIPGEVDLVYTPHSEPQTIPRFVPGLKRVTVRGTYHPKMMELLRALYSFGLLDPERQVTVDGKRVDFQPLLREALLGDGTLRPPGIEPLYILRVRVTGEEETQVNALEITVGHDPGWDKLPQARMTALPTAFSMRLIGRKTFQRPGVCGPELFSDADVEACLAHLASRGLWVHRVQTERRQGCAG